MNQYMQVPAADAKVRTGLQTEDFVALSDPRLSIPSQDAKEVLL